MHKDLIEIYITQALFTPKVPMIGYQVQPMYAKIDLLHLASRHMGAIAMHKLQ